MNKKQQQNTIGSLQNALCQPFRARDIIIQRKISRWDVYCSSPPCFFFVYISTLYSFSSKKKLWIFKCATNNKCRGERKKIFSENMFVRLYLISLNALSFGCHFRRREIKKTSPNRFAVAENSWKQAKIKEKQMRDTQTHVQSKSGYILHTYRAIIPSHFAYFTKNRTWMVFFSFFLLSGSTNTSARRKCEQERSEREIMCRL